MDLVESELIFADILTDYNIFSTDNIPSKKPIATILGGQPGSGKSFLKEQIERIFNKKFIFISTDDLRFYHPDYLKLLNNPQTVQNAANIVNSVASSWTERLIKFCIEQTPDAILFWERILEEDTFSTYMLKIGSLYDEDFENNIQGILMNFGGLRNRLSIEFKAKISQKIDELLAKFAQKK